MRRSGPSMRGSPTAARSSMVRNTACPTPTSWSSSAGSPTERSAIRNGSRTCARIARAWRLGPQFAGYSPPKASERIVDSGEYGGAFAAVAEVDEAHDRGARDAAKADAEDLVQVRQRAGAGS